MKQHRPVNEVYQEIVLITLNVLNLSDYSFSWLLKLLLFETLLSKISGSAHGPLSVGFIHLHSSVPCNL